MAAPSAGPGEIAASLWRNRALIGLLAKRDALGRYKGSVLGLLWSFFNPLLMLTVYTFVFSGIFKARWTSDSTSTTQYALVLFAGLIVFTLFAECLTRAPSLIVGNVNYVKKVAFPLEILPWVSFGAAAFHFLVSLAVWLIVYVLLSGIPPATALLLPLILLPIALLTMGLAWFLAALGVFVRDVAQMVGVLTSALMFLSPIFYPLEVLPENLRPYLFLNPLTLAVVQMREVLILGRLPDWSAYGVYLAVAVVVATLGFAFFQKTRKGFADVL